MCSCFDETEDGRKSEWCDSALPTIDRTEEPLTTATTTFTQKNASRPETAGSNPHPVQSKLIVAWTRIGRSNVLFYDHTPLATTPTQSGLAVKERFHRMSELLSRVCLVSSLFPARNEKIKSHRSFRSDRSEKTPDGSVVTRFQCSKRLSREVSPSKAFPSIDANWLFKSDLVRHAWQ